MFDPSGDMNDDASGQKKKKRKNPSPALPLEQSDPTTPLATPASPVKLPDATPPSIVRLPSIVLSLEQLKASIPTKLPITDEEIPEAPPPPRKPTEIRGAYKDRVAKRTSGLSIDPVLFAQTEDPKLRKIITENANLWERYGIRLDIDYPYKDGVVVIDDKHIEITGIDKKTNQPKTKTVPFKVSLSRATRDEALGVIEAVDKNVASVLPEEFFSVLYNESVTIAVVRDLKAKKGDGRTLETNGLDLLDGRETLMAVRSNPTRTLSTNANKGDFDTAAYAVLHETIHRWLHKYEKFDLKWPNALATIQDKLEFNARREKVINGEIGVRPDGFTDWQAAFSGEESDDQVATIANLIWNPKLEFEKAKSDRVLAQKIDIAKKILFEASQKLMDQDYWSFRIKGAGDVQQYLESKRSIQLTKND